MLSKTHLQEHHNLPNIVWGVNYSHRHYIPEWIGVRMAFHGQRGSLEHVIHGQRILRVVPTVTVLDILMMRMANSRKRADPVLGRRNCTNIRTC